jgi:adenosylmethionine-8-amino-7-oxononanoate aminotransferase
MASSLDLAHRDLQTVWHPCTQTKDHEALLRPTGNVVHFMPPYVITPGGIDRLVATARDGIEAATCD